MKKRWANASAISSFTQMSAKRSPRRWLRIQELESRAVPALIVVTSQADTVIEDGAVTLREAIQSINSSANINMDVVADTKSGLEPYGTADEIRFGSLFSSSQTITLDPAFGQIPISLAMVITGPGSGKLTVSGDINPTPTNRIFNINIIAGSDAVTLTGMTIANGLLSTGNGGGVLFANETLTLNGVVVTNNKAASGGGVASSAATTINIANSTISLNQANSNAGGIGMFGTGTSSVTITNSVLQSNTCVATTGFGGAVYCGNVGIVNVADSLFEENRGGIGSSAGLAGAIYISSTATSTLTNTIFRNNQGGAGGAIRYQGATNVTIDKCLFEGNMSTKGNGGVFRFTSATTTVNVSNSSFINNQSFTGGGVFGIEGNGAVVTVTNSTFSGNAANGTTAITGGGVLATTSTAYNGSITFNNSTLTNNSVPSGVAKGGAIFINGINGTLLLESSIVAGNSNSVNQDISAPAARSITINHSLIGALDPILFPTPGGTYDPLLVGTEASPVLAKLNPLGANGGPYQTHSLMMGSPAINAGSNPTGATFDQRGSGFARVVGGTADIGALEIQSAATPPTVSSITWNNGNSQRSLVTAVKVSFSESVTLGGGAFVLERYANGAPGTVGVTVNQLGGDVTLTFNNTGSITLDPGASLPDGKYQLTIVANNVTGAGGALDGNKNGTSQGSPNDDVTSKVHRLFGDANGDGAVGAADFAQFRSVFGLAGPSIFDFNNDNNTGAPDFAQFRARFGLGGFAP